MNSQYIAAMKTEELMGLIKKQFSDAGKQVKATDEMMLKVIDLYKVRIKTLSEFGAMTDHYFGDDYFR